MTERNRITNPQTLALRDLQVYAPAIRTTSAKAKEGLVADWVHGKGWLPGPDGIPSGILLYGREPADELRWGLLMKDTLLVGEYVTHTSMAELYRLFQDVEKSPAAVMGIMLVKAGYPGNDETDQDNNTLDKGLHIFVDRFDLQHEAGAVERAVLKDFIRFMAYYASVYLRAKDAQSAEAVWTRPYLTSLTDGTHGKLAVWG